MKCAIKIGIALLAFSTVAYAQPYAYAKISWIQPRSPITNNVLQPARFQVYALLAHGARAHPHGFSDSTDYGAEYLFWADVDLGRLPWRVIYYVAPFWAHDQLANQWWLIDGGPPATLMHGPGGGGVHGRIRWEYWR